MICKYALSHAQSAGWTRACFTQGKPQQTFAHLYTPELCARL